jgi:tripartite-type tricarboxylate transporter receptor subunit TctC
MASIRVERIGLWLGALLAASSATAQTDYPNQPVRMVVPFSAGSVTDLLARSIGDKLSERWGQQVIVENRPGIPGTASVAKSAPDGLTLMLTSNGHTVAAVLNKSLPFDPVKDFAGVTQVASVPLVLIVPPDLPAKSLRELIALAKEKPGTLNFASSGLASTAYVSGELLKQTAKLDIVHVPYKGAPESLTGIMRSDSHMFFAGINIALDLIQSGKVHPLAVATSKRIASLPSVPTFAEAGMPEFEYDAWFGIMAPANTPAAVLDKVRRDVDAILQLPDVRKRLESQGVITVVSTPQKFDMLIRSDTERFGKMLREAGVAAN